MSLKKQILKVLYSSSVALTVKEICQHVFNNGYPCEYITCQLWRKCKYNQVVKEVKELRKLSLVRAFRAKIRNVNSPVGYVNCVLIYVREEQLYKRLEIEKRSKTILDYTCKVCKVHVREESVWWLKSILNLELKHIDGYEEIHVYRNYFIAKDREGWYHICVADRNPLSVSCTCARSIEEVKKILKEKLKGEPKIQLTP